MKLLDLFAGIGGFSLAAHWMGWETVAFVEWDKYCQKVLKKNFPGIPIYGDIKEFDGTKYRGTVDIVCGGDPCQPSSVAGLGKGTEDHRFLWPEYFRVVRQVQPPWVFNENVSGTISNGILDIKIDDLEREGYACQAYCIPAESVGAVHQRERIWLVAHNPDRHNIIRGAGKDEVKGKSKGVQERDKIQHIGEPVDLWAFNTDPDSERFKELYDTKKPGVFTEGISRYFGFGAHPHGNIPGDIIKSGIVGMLNGLPEGMDYADRPQRIKQMGNAVVPQVVYEIFKAIEKANEIRNQSTQRS